MTTVDPVTGAERIAALTDRELAASIDVVLEFRHSGVDADLCDDEIRELLTVKHRRHG